MPVHKPEEAASEADNLESASKRRKNDKDGDSEKESEQESVKGSKSNGTAAPTPSKASKAAENGTTSEGGKDQKSAKKKAPKDGKEKSAAEADDHSKCNGATTPAAKANKDHSTKKKDKEKKSDHKGKKHGHNSVVKSSHGHSGKKHRNHAQDTNTSSADEAAPPEPREEIKVHMARFLQYQPSGISAIAHDDIGERLAVARDNGDIQIWSTSLPRWHPVAACAGSQESKIRSLCWSRCKAEDCPGGARLFSASLSGHVTEWSLGSLMPIHVTETYGGPAWCMSVSPDQSMLAVGCHDGMCRLFSVTEDSGPMFAKSLPPHPGQVSIFFIYDFFLTVCVHFFLYVSMRVSMCE
jgi:hypothetical protein